VVEIRWPYLAGYVRAHPEAVEHGNVPEDVKALLRDPDVAHVIDGADKPFTAELVGQCAGSPRPSA
jgi:hypothetical protein